MASRHAEAVDPGARGRTLAARPAVPSGQPSAGHGTRLSRRRLVAGAAGVVAGVALAGSGPPRETTVARQDDAAPALPAAAPDTPAAAPPDLPAFSEDEVDAVLAELAAAGVAVYGAPDAGAPLVPVSSPGPLALLRSQVRAMVLEATNGSGVLGADLDALVFETDPSGPLAEARDWVTPGSPLAPAAAPSLLLAAYVGGAESPGAALARRFVPAPDIERARQATYPGLVLALFAAELARESTAAAGPIPDATQLLHRARPAAFVAPAAAQAGVCSAAQGFIDRTLNALFGALHVDLGSSAPGRILGGIINWLLDKAQAAVRAALRELTAPVLNLIKTVAGVIGTVSVVVSALRPWSLRMTPVPADTRLAVGAEPPIPGAVTCGVDLGGLDEWPADLVDCAAQSGAPLPPLRPAGAPCSWAIEQSRLAPLVQATAQPASLDQDGAAQFAYVTASEDEKTARGTPVDGWVRLTLTIQRPEVADLQRTISNLLFAQLPDIVARFVRPILGPTVDALLGKLSTLAESRASTTVRVLYHTPKEDDPDPEPEPEPAEAQPSSVAVSFDPLEFGPVSLVELSAGTCDGTTWQGRMRLVLDLAGGVLNVEYMDQTLDVGWSFAGGDRTTTTVGPFETVVSSPLRDPEPYLVTYELGIERQRGADGRTSSLTFELATTLNYGGDTFDAYGPGYANTGVPIAVTPTNPAC